jgi:cell wall-associated NlpC family hydrolase
LALGAAALLCGAVVPVIAQTPATAGTIQTLQEKAAALASEINAAYAKLSVLDEAYNQAETAISGLKTDVVHQNQAIGASQHQLASDNAHLRNVAIDEYVNGAASGFSVFMNGNQQQLPAQQAYLSAASSNLDVAVSSVKIDHHELAVHKQQLQQSEATEVAYLHRISSDVSQAKAVTANLEAALSQVKGQLAQAVAAQEKAQAAALAAQEAKAAAQQPPPPPPPPINPNPPGGGGVTGSGSGAAAVKAAESQLGVPYVWGGATPGVGFDCSGLTMWSWGQAGVSLAHGATDQYYEIAHVSMSNLEPGDLIFYGDSGYLYHVVMYVGSGPYGSDTVIQAEETGTNVMFSPIPPGAYGAGQP